MAAPATPPRRPRGDAALWAAATAMALMAVVVGALLRSPVSNAAPTVTVTTAASEPSIAPAPGGKASPSASAPIGLVTDPAEGRGAVFQARVSALRTLEGALARAFAPAVSEPKRVAAARPRPVRVARGATPQACLAQAVYYEARGEPAEGQAAVAQVVLNRTHSARHPADVCGVVFEGAARSGCQFSFACDPRLGARRPEAGAWRRAETVAAQAMTGPGRPELAGALNYHADYVKPRWAAQLERTVEIGRHIFYAAARPAERALAGWSFTAPPTPTPAAGA